MKQSYKGIAEQWATREGGSPYPNLMGDFMKAFEGIGETERADIGRYYQGIRTTGYQNLVSKGLAGTTLPSTQEASVGRQEVGALGALDERLRREQFDYMRFLSGMMSEYGAGGGYAPSGTGTQGKWGGRATGPGGFGGASFGGGGYYDPRYYDVTKKRRPDIEITDIHTRDRG